MILAKDGPELEPERSVFCQQSSLGAPHETDALLIRRAPSGRLGGQRIVIGVAVDLQNRTLHFAYNGAWYHAKKTAALARLLREDMSLFPALSGLNCGAVLSFNGGPHFRFPFRRRCAGMASLLEGDLPIQVAMRNEHVRACKALLDDQIQTVKRAIKRTGGGSGGGGELKAEALSDGRSSGGGKVWEGRNEGKGGEGKEEKGADGRGGLDSRESVIPETMGVQGEEREEEAKGSGGAGIEGYDDESKRLQKQKRKRRKEELLRFMDDQDAHGLQLIHHAVRLGERPIVKRLIRHKTRDGATALVNSRDMFGRTPLSLACRHGHEAIVRFLLTAGADYRVADIASRSPLYMAAKNGNDLELVMLLDFVRAREPSALPAAVNATNSSSQTALYAAAKNGHARCVQHLLSSGADCFVKDRKKRLSPLNYACRNGHEAVARALLSHLADQDERTEAGARTGNDAERPDGATDSAGADGPRSQLLTMLEDTDKKGNRALDAACTGGHARVVRLILHFTERAVCALRESGTHNSGYENGSGRGYGDGKVSGSGVDKKSDNGSDKRVGEGVAGSKEIEGGTVHASSSDGGVLSLLGHRNRNDETTVYQAAREGHSEVVKILLRVLFAGITSRHKSKADAAERRRRRAIAFQPNREGWTPLNTASFLGHVEVVKALVQYKADVLRKDVEGRSPLYSAAKRGHEEVVRFLLGRGAQVDATDNDGKTPLYSAAKNGFSGVVRILLNAGADANLLTCGTAAKGFKDKRSPL